MTTTMTADVRLVSVSLQELYFYFISLLLSASDAPLYDS